MVSQKFVAEQPRVPFDFAQGRLSTAIGAQYAPISAQDDSFLLDANFRLSTLEGLHYLAFDLLMLANSARRHMQVL